MIAVADMAILNSRNQASDMNDNGDRKQTDGEKSVLDSYFGHR